MSFQPLTSRRLPIALLAALALAAVAAVVALAGGGSADAGKSKVLGKEKNMPKPNCPTPEGKHPPSEECNVMAGVTGFQTATDGKKQPFLVRTPGRIVAFGLDLSRPSKDERKTLSGWFPRGPGKGESSAQLAILREKKNRRYRLLRKSPYVELQRYYGKKPVIALDKPLRVQKGDVVALTTPSWLSNLAVNRVSAKNKWRSSRDFKSRKRCGGTTKAAQEYLRENTRPQTKVKSTRHYRCGYEGNRLLYWAYLAPKGNGDGGNGGGGGGANKTRTLGAAPSGAPAGNDLPSGGVTP